MIQLAQQMHQARLPQAQTTALYAPQKSVTNVPANSSTKNFIKAGEPRERLIM